MVVVNFGFLCTNKTQQPEGGFSADHIGIRGMVSPTVPCRHPSLTAHVEMKFVAAEIAPKILSLHILDLDGNDVIEFEDVSWTPAPPLPGEFYSLDGVEFPLGQVEFPKFGEYTIVFGLDGVDMEEWLFRVESPKASP